MSLPKGLLKKLGFAEAAVKSLHTGISDTFLVTSDHGKMVVKTLRENRPGNYCPNGEIAWIYALSTKGFCCVQPYFKNNLQKNILEHDGKIFWIYEYIDGVEPDASVLEHYKFMVISCEICMIGQPESLLKMTRSKKIDLYTTETF